MESENPFECFISDTKEYANVWDTIEMKVVATKGDNNTHYLLGMHATLLTNATPMSEILLDLENVIMLHEVRSITRTELNGIIKGLENGVIKIGEKELKLKDFGRFVFERKRSHGRSPDVDFDWPYFRLKAVSSKSVRELINEEEINTKLNKWGYDELWTACEENLGFKVGGAYSPHIYLTAPIYIIACLLYTSDAADE